MSKSYFWLFLTLTISFGANAYVPVEPYVIYGHDDRIEYYEIQDPSVRAMADATVALVTENSIKFEGELAKIATRVYGTKVGLCEAERYYHQGSLAFCSGFLVAPDLVVTAGHCMEDSDSCESTQFLFDYKLQYSGEVVDSVAQDKAYRCREIVKARTGQVDFAVVRLDRPVTDRAPVKVNNHGTVEEGDLLSITGYPKGLPLKYAAGAQVRFVSETDFEANLDSYSGNSGSPVFNQRTGEVEGILIGGEGDFTAAGSCLISKQCKDDSCQGETVTKIDQVLRYLERE